MTTALLLIDIPNDVRPTEQPSASRAADVVAVASRLMPLYPLVFALRASGTAGANLVAKLDQQRITRVFDRGEASIGVGPSGILDDHGRDVTGLAGALRDAHVDEVVVLGLTTKPNVHATALDLRRLGLRTLVVDDAYREACHDDTLDAQRAALDALDRAGVQLVSSHLLALPREILRESKYLRMVQRGHWEFVERTHPRGAVVILAITDDGKALLTDQWRIPVGRRVIELPAGLVGDEPGMSHEPLVEAARRELFEETGYEASEWAEVFHAVSSAGLSNECATFFLARGLRKTGPGGGDAKENIRVHEVPVDQLDQWLADRFAAGYHVDARICAAIYLWRQRGW